jgi:hypothetical protein
MSTRGRKKKGTETSSPLPAHAVVILPMHVSPSATITILRLFDTVILSSATAWIQYLAELAIAKAEAPTRVGETDPLSIRDETRTMARLVVNTMPEASSSAPPELQQVIMHNLMPLFSQQFQPVVYAMSQPIPTASSSPMKRKRYGLLTCLVTLAQRPLVDHEPGAALKLFLHALTRVERTMGMLWAHICLVPADDSIFDQRTAAIVLFELNAYPLALGSGKSHAAAMYLVFNVETKARVLSTAQWIARTRAAPANASPDWQADPFALDMTRLTFRMGGFGTWSEVMGKLHHVTHGDARAGGGSFTPCFTPETNGTEETLLVPPLLAEDDSGA